MPRCGAAAAALHTCQPTLPLCAHDYAIRNRTQSCPACGVCNSPGWVAAICPVAAASGEESSPPCGWVATGLAVHIRWVGGASRAVPVVEPARAGAALVMHLLHFTLLAYHLRTCCHISGSAHSCAHSSSGRGGSNQTLSIPAFGVRSVKG